MLEKIKKITSANNPIIKEVVGLKKSRNRRKSGLFLIDGKREIETTLNSNYELTNLFISEKIKNDELKYIKGLKNIQIYKLPDLIFNKISYKENPDGFLAIAKVKKLNIKDFKEDKNVKDIIVLENIEKPGNLGAIIRTAYALGIKNILLTENKIDIFNPNIIRASEGYIFKVNLFELSNEETLSWLKDNNYNILSTYTRKDSLNYLDTNLKGKNAFIFGSEADGLSKFWLDNSDRKIKIPMQTGIDSLNVSVSVAIILYESHRQNRK